MVQIIEGTTNNYTDLSLHSASANGNIGLVHYALTHGQPINSLLNGVLPIHAAASSGNEQVLNILLEFGADVNSPRVPRRHDSNALGGGGSSSSSGGRGKSSGIAVGTAGSTPLHFAAANGHLDIIGILLENGARVNTVEKYGVTAEMLARQKGHLEVAEFLRQWSENVGSNEDDTESSNSNRKKGSLKRSAKNLGRKLSSNSNKGLDFPPSGSNLSPNLYPTSNSSRRSSISSTSHVSISDSTTTNNQSSNNSARRPSLPSVFEKASHPGAALKQALGMSTLLRQRSIVVSSANNVDDDDDDSKSVKSGFWSRSRESSTSEGGDERTRRKSEEFSRLARKESVESSISSSSNTSRSISRQLQNQQRQHPSTAPYSKTKFDSNDLGFTSPSSSYINSSGFSLNLPTSSSNNNASTSNSTSLANTFYRPRQSSQLSGRNFTTTSTYSDDASTSSAGGGVAGGSRGAPVFFDDENEETVNKKLSKGVLNSLPLPYQPSRARSNRRARRESSGGNSALSITSTTPSLPTATQRSVRENSLPGEFGELEIGGDEDQRGSVVEDGDILDGVATLKVSNRSGTLMVDPKKVQQQQQQARNRGDSISSSNTTNSSFSRRTGGSSIIVPKPFTILHSNSIDALRGGNQNRNRSDSAGTDGRFSSSPASSYSGPNSGNSLSTYANTTISSNSTAPTSLANSQIGTSQFSPISSNGSNNNRPALSPLYEMESNGLVGLTSAQASAKVKKAEKDLLAFDGNLGNGVEGGTGGGSGKLTLSQQLAAYGQSLAMERKITALEEGEKSSGEQQYHYESISGKKEGKKVDRNSYGSTGPSYLSNTLTPTTKSPLRTMDDSTPTNHVNHLVPKRRIVSPQNYLMPPPPHSTKTKRSVSPATIARNSSGNYRSAEIIPSTSSLISSSLQQLPVSRRASSPPTSASSSVVLGSGTGGVSYVEAAPPSSNSNSLSNNRRSGSSKSPTSNMDKNGHNHNHSHGQSSQRGTSVTSSEQIILDRAENTRIAAAIPIAPPPSRPIEKKKGFARRLFSRS